MDLEPGSFDIITAAAVFHHLREDAEWEAVFSACYRVLKPGGCLWVSDLVSQEHPGVQARMWERYGEYLVGLKGEEFRDHVFDYIEKEDSPRSVAYQLNLLQKVGFTSVDVLHKNGPFAVFGGVKGG
jgi:tRNA (cmo5U34)-methyltransferase